ncbi:type II secretion system F family protein [soil metagenome]
MKEFAYVALDKGGKEVRGVTLAQNEQALLTKLTGLGYYPLRVNRHARASRSADITALPGLRIVFHRVKQRHITAFTRQLATLYEAGLPLTRALSTLRQQTDSVVFKDKIGEMIAVIEAGGSLSEAMAEHPRIFSPLYVNMVRAGEAGGALEQILNKIADFLEKSQAIRSKVRAAVTYPAVVGLLGTAIVSFILLRIMPRFEEIYRQLGAELPWLTQALIDASRILATRLPWVIAAVVMLCFFLRQIYRTREGRHFFDWIALNFYILGPIIMKVSMARFAGTFATLLHSGVPILQALDIVRNTTGNEVVGRAVERIHRAVRDGDSMAETMEHSRVFPPIVIQMVAVGEETGAIDRLLAKAAEAYEREVDDTVSALTSILEPVLIVMLGGIVGVIVTALYLPLFTMGSKIP